MPGRHSRTKGHQFERDIAIEFQELGWRDARRHLEYQDGEANGIDLANTDPFAIQCKRGKGYAPITAIEEINAKPITHEPMPIGVNMETFDLAMSTSPLGERIPLLITKADHKPTMAVLPWEELRKLIREAYKVF